MHANSQDFGAQFKTAALYGDRMTAAGTGDNTERTSGNIDCKGYNSGTVVICGRTTAATSETLKATVKIAEADDDGTGSPGSFGADETLASAVTLVTGGASPQNFSYELDVTLCAKRKRWVKFKLTLDLSASGTDVADWGATLVMGGASTLPAA